MISNMESCRFAILWVRFGDRSTSQPEQSPYHGSK